MVFQLSVDNLDFPAPGLAENDGFLAIGGDLSVARLKKAYSMGIFPWYNEHEPICWFSPHRRWVIFPEKVHVSHSMKKILKKNIFEITFDRDFAAVISNCASVPRPGQEGTWILPEMQEAFIALHKEGVAHSVEVWKDGRLVGGMYGVAVHKVFCGESMFSLVSNASKAALIALCRSGLYDLIDAQIPNEHTASLGGEMIDRKTFEQFLQAE